MKTNDSYRPNRLPEKYKVPPNKELEDLKGNRNIIIAALAFVFLLLELFLIIDEDNLEEGAFVGLTVLCFGPSFIIFMGLAWFGLGEEIKPLEEQQHQKEERMTRRIQENRRTARNCEDKGRYDIAIEIWDDLGENSEVARITKEQKEREETKLRKEREEKRKVAHTLEKNFQKERKNDDGESDKYLDHALEIWEELGEDSEVERINELKVQYVYGKLKKKIDELKDKGVDCTQLEEELAKLEKNLN